MPPTCPAELTSEPGVEESSVPAPSTQADAYSPAGRSLGTTRSRKSCGINRGRRSPHKPASHTQRPSDCGSARPSVHTQHRQQRLRRPTSSRGRRALYRPNFLARPGTAHFTQPIPGPRPAPGSGRPSTLFLPEAQGELLEVRLRLP